MVIPSNAEGVPVTEIGRGAFSRYYERFLRTFYPKKIVEQCSRGILHEEVLTAVYIPFGVTKIGEAAFYGCQKLTSARLPSTITEIGPSAFYSCKSLTEVRIPENVTSLGKAAFCRCQSLKNIQIP